MIFQNMDRIVFAGDSITDMYSAQPVGEIGDGLGAGYVRIIDSMLSAVYPEISVRITNSGVGGNTSRDLLNRWERDVLSLNPQWVSVCIGINDAWRQFDAPAFPEMPVYPEEYENNLDKMLSSLAGRVKGAFVLTPYYIEREKASACGLKWMNTAPSAKGLRINTAVYLLMCRRRLTAFWNISIPQFWQ